MKKYVTQETSVTNILELYKFIRTRYPFTSILESLGDYDDEFSRYSIIGVKPNEYLSSDGQISWLTNCQSGEKTEVEWLSVLDGWTSLGKNAYIDSPLQLGAIGYIGYEEKFRFENLTRIREKDHNIPTVFLVKYSLLLVYDRKDEVSYWVFDGDINDQDIASLEKDFQHDEQASHPLDFAALGDIEPNSNCESYLESIKRTIDYIKNGDIFQANITMRFSGKYIGDPLVLYEALRAATPNPFFGFFDFPCPLISTSPERFLLIKDRDILSYPIKGTIRCMIDGKDQKDTLAQSEKNRAENIMIVDLIRNDIGKVCVQGSVQVPEICTIKKFNSLYHMESVVAGRLSEHIRTSDILRAAFPGGSITGAPKIRAMEIVEELEFTDRGPYTGLLGFFGEMGWIDTAIAIRSIYFDQERFFFHGGGGIVVDSAPEEEYQELLLKIEIIKSCINGFNLNPASTL